MNGVRIAEGEVLREATRIFRKLMPEGARLTPQGDGYAVAATNQEPAKKHLSVSLPLVEAFKRRGWLDVAEGGALMLSDAGLGLVRRALSPTDPYGAQHRLDAKREIAGETGSIFVTVNEGESPLGWLRRRRGPDGKPLIGETQFSAGERLRADFTLAQMTPRMAVDLTAPVVAGRRGVKDFSLPETVVAAKQRVRNALVAVGSGLADLLIDICCHLMGLEAAERQKGWPQRSAKVVLAIALDRLAAHYGTGSIIGTGSRMRAWSAQPENETAREP